MVRYIAGDVGGTNTRLILVEVGPNGQESKGITKRYASSDFKSLDDVVALFIKDVGLSLGKVDALCVAVAGPVTRGADDVTCNFTNLDWLISRNSLRRNLQIPHVDIINDFGAVGYALTDLKHSDVIVVNPGSQVHGAPVACLGAGTGLGEVYLTFNGREYDVWATEGGHTDFAPTTSEEYDFMQFVKEEEKIGRVSIERLVRGAGINLAYQYYKIKHSHPASKEVEEELARVEKPEKRNHVIATWGGKKDPASRDPLCTKALETFFRLYASEAGNFSLKTCPFGGLFIVGSISNDLKEFVVSDKFVENFVAKGRMRPLLKRIPVYLVKNTDVGVQGAMVKARRILHDSAAFTGPIIAYGNKPGAGEENVISVQVAETEKTKNRSWVTTSLTTALLGIATGALTFLILSRKKTQ